MRPPSKRERPARGTFADWLAHASSDLNLARLARTRDDILVEQVCFHAQQAAEKALKAVLLFRGIEFPLTHDIEQLLELAEIGGVVVPVNLDGAGNLTPYAVEFRYPGHFEEISVGEVDEAISLAAEMVEWASVETRDGGSGQ